MAAEGKPTPSRASFPSSIKMCHSFSAAWHHSEMDALGRERERALVLVPNTFRMCMECCWNNLISTSATPTHTWVRPQQPPPATGGDKQGGNGIPCPSPAAPTPSCYRDRKFITVVRRERRCPSGKSYPASKVPFNGKERGNLGRKDFRTPASSKGHLIQKALSSSIAQSKNKRHPFKIQ